MDEGEVQVDSVLAMSFADITPALARESGFRGLVDLLKVAKHGRGENVYLVRFHYVPPTKARPRRPTPPRKRPSRRRVAVESGPSRSRSGR